MFLKRIIAYLGILCLIGPTSARAERFQPRPHRSHPDQRLVSGLAVGGLLVGMTAWLLYRRYRMTQQEAFERAFLRVGGQLEEAQRPKRRFIKPTAAVYTIKGLVRDENGTHLPRCRVQLSQRRHQYEPFYTDYGGYFTIMIIPKYPNDPVGIVCYPALHDDYYEPHAHPSFVLSYPQTLVEVVLPFTSKGKTRNQLWVHKEYANLYSEPDPRSRILEMLPRGTSLELLGKEGIWYRVITPGLEGWVHQFSVSRKRPIRMR